MNTTTISPRTTTPRGTNDSTFAGIEASLRTTDDAEHRCVEAHSDAFAPPDGAAVGRVARVAPVAPVAPAARPTAPTGLRRIAWAVADLVWAPAPTPTAQIVASLGSVDRLGERS